MPSSKKIINNTAPKSDEIEISLFGRGVGECILVHLGFDEWMIIDSHIHPETKEPVALTYLKSIDVDFSKQVKFIVITHWDKDHILGATKLIIECPSAKVWFPNCFCAEDFCKFVQAYSDYSNVNNLKQDFSLNEIRNALTIAFKEDRGNWLIMDRVLMNATDPIKRSVHALSPIDKEYTDFLAFIASKLPKEGKALLKIADRKRNYISSVILITIGETNIILGADMISDSGRNKGWAAIIDKSTMVKSMTTKASVYKAAHHGAESGDSSEVWNKLLCSNPITIIAPYTALQEPLPTRKDIMRIEKQTTNAYLTSTPYDSPRIVGRHPKAQKFAKHEIPWRNLRCLERGIGHIRLRGKINSKLQLTKNWKIEKLENAISLGELKKTRTWLLGSLPQY